MKERICARCGKRIMERRFFVLNIVERRKYSSYLEEKPLDLFFHENCIRKISVKVRSLYDLLKVMNKIEGK